MAAMHKNCRQVLKMVRTNLQKFTRSLLEGTDSSSPRCRCPLQGAWRDSIAHQVEGHRRHKDQNTWSRCTERVASSGPCRYEDWPYRGCDTYSYRLHKEGTRSSWSPFV